MKNVVLNNDVEMPQVGLGTFLIPAEELSRTIGEAYEMGYRQFDTAWKYQNEKDISKALKENGIKREDVFITTKINAAALNRPPYRYGRKSIFNIPNGKTIAQVIEESFSNLETEYIDLFLIHYPYPNSDKIWKELEQYYKRGRIRAIGVSNFLQPHLDALLEIAEIQPTVNQFEISPLNTQKNLIEFCHSRNIAVQAMSTFSHFRSIQPRKEIIESDVILPIARKYHKSAVQIVLRWLLQQDIILIPKTWYKPHLQENINIFDFELTEEEMLAIDSMDKGEFLNYNPLGQQQGFFRSVRNRIEFREWNKSHPHNVLFDILDWLRN